MGSKVADRKLIQEVIEMVFSKRFVMLGLAVLIGLTMSACNWNAQRNADGSWTVTATMTESDAQQAIDMALDDPLIKAVQVNFQNGYMAVSADRQSVDGSHTDKLTFRIDLSVVNGHLGLVVSDVRLAGQPVDSSLVSVWNQRIANRLERAGQRNPNSTLESVAVTPNDLTMVWHAQGRQGRQ
jgi:hypothetical protein